MQVGTSQSVQFEKLRFVKSFPAPTWTAPQLLARLTVAVLEADLEGGDARDKSAWMLVIKVTQNWMLMFVNRGT